MTRIDDYAKEVEILKTTQLVFMFGTLVLVLAFAACSPTTSTTVATEKWDLNDPANQKNVSKITIHPTDPILGMVVNYGNGVYYFPHTRADFANTLSKFLNIHTNLEVTAMTWDVVRRWSNRTLEIDAGFNSERESGAAVGYFVTFREKK